MNGDLISRSSFAEFIKSLPKTPNGHSKQYSESDILYYIENQPTAYDVEKVIMNLRCDTNCPNCSPNCVDAGICGFDEMLKQAIEIVRKGGVE